MKSTRLRKKGKENHRMTSDSRSSPRNDEILSLWESFLELDLSCTKALSLCASPDSPLGRFRPLMKVLEISCHGIPWLLGTVIVFICVHKPEDVEILVNLFCALIFDLICVGVTKMFFRRQRPANNKMDMFATVSVDHFSFPSGHATRAAMLLSFFVLRVFNSYLLSVGIAVWAVCVSLSRLMLGRHHAFDVVCGFLMGLLEYFLYSLVWIPKEKCLEWLEPYFGHVHL